MNEPNIFYRIITKRRYSILYGAIALIIPSIFIVALTPIIKNGLNITPIIIAFIATWLAIFIILKYNKEIDNKTNEDNQNNQKDKK